MDPYERSRGGGGQSGGGDVGTNLASLGNGFLTYLKTRSADHWLFLAVGVIFGLLIGG
ncbi:MAG TPA: hypothetical protein VFG47_01435 [Geminicoccaceae bacterium]|nr:hypothetical protein [Geminicoccaceae bacterium]